MKTTGTTVRRFLIALSVLMVSTLLALYLLAPAPAVSGQAPLQDIQDINTLRSRFNTDRGHVRLILLLSPT